MSKTGPIHVKFLADKTTLEDLLLLALHSPPDGIILSKSQIRIFLLGQRYQ